MAINWELARIPDFVGNALQARDQATQRGLEMERRNALQEYARNPQAGASRLLAADPATAISLENARSTREQQAAAAQSEQQDRIWKTTSEVAGRLSNVYQSKKDAQSLVAAFDALAPRLRAVGGSDQDLMGIRQGLMTDPEGTLLTFGAAAAEKAGYEIRNAGEEVFVIDPTTGELKQRYRGARTMPVSEGVALYEIPGTGGGQPAMPQAPAGGSDWVSDVAAAAGDATVTSGYRTPADNKRVGGVPNSRHMSGEAVDLVPRPGETMAQLAARLAGVPGVQAINEGDHVHVEREPGAQMAQAPQSPGGPRLLVQRPKAQSEGYRILSAAEKQSLGLPTDGTYQASASGQISRVSEGASERPPTEGQINAASLSYAAFGGNERMNDLAKRGIFKPQTATDSLFNVDNKGQVIGLTLRTEQDRLFVQAAKEFLAPILRKDTGAAVTDGELRFYMDTYIPKFEDSPAVLAAKANARETALRRIYGTGRKAYVAEYGEPPEVAFRTYTDPRAMSLRPPKGANKGKDGAYYAEDPNKKGSFPRVAPGPDGVWRMKSANGQTLRFE